MRPLTLALIPCLCLIAAPAAPAADKPAPATTRAAEAREAYLAITDAQVKSITFDDAEMDNGFVGPLAKDLSRLDGDDRKKFDEWVNKLDDWKDGRDPAVGQRVRNLVAVAAMGDMGRSAWEGETAYAVVEKLKRDVPRDQLIKACAWVILKPDEGTVPAAIPELGFDDEIEAQALRTRSILYAKKVLGRVLGKLPVKDE